MEKTKPIMKWPGGKRRVLPEIIKYIPNTYNNYYEPFLGGGALFFHKQPEKAVISDVNSELINLYVTVQNNVQALIKELKTDVYKNTLETFLEIRAWDRNHEIYNNLTNVERAARTIYLNKTGFNGLYRVNKNNQFNAHYGHYENPSILDEENLLHVSELLSQHNISILNKSYEEALKDISGSENFIYLDPPYIPLSVTASFAKYTKDGFGLEEQKKLRDTAIQLDNQNNYVLLSNSDTELTRELYKDFILKPIEVKRSVGASAATRVKAGELLILGKTLHQKLQNSL
jgi:DNA adenine methylase